MDALQQLQFDDRFVRTVPGDADLRNVPRPVHGACFTPVQPSPVAAPRLVAHSREVAAMIGLDDASVQSAGFAEVFAGNRILDGMKPYAACYGGHQFGHWAGQLGDGRAITLGEVQTTQHGRQELQLKGAGRTPYSRLGDGRAVLRSSVREFLCSEAMHHLGVPTTRALSLMLTGDLVPRDMFYTGNVRREPGAIVCRVAPSFLRFGNFQLLSARQDVSLLTTLVNDTITTHFPSLGPPSRDSILAWLTEVGRRTAVMVAHWMRVGFVHGVMNTDNMSILGLTMDYGPYGWIDIVDDDWTPNTSDAHGRRYRFGAQPHVAGWNLARFAEALYPLIGAVPPLEDALEVYQQTFAETHRGMMAQKLGLATLTPTDDQQLLKELRQVLHSVEVDMTLFFRNLAHVPADPQQDDATLLAPIRGALYEPELTAEQTQRFGGLLRELAGRWQTEGRGAARVASMNAANPRYVLRNYLAQQAIERAEAGDFSEVSRLLDVLRRPYDDQPGDDDARMPDWARNRPGCSMLSCSS